MIWKTGLALAALLVAEGCTIDIWPSSPTNKPGAPVRPIGPVTVYGYPGYQYPYETRAADPDGDQLVYQFSINGVVVPAEDVWSAYLPSGATVVYYAEFAGFGYAASVRARAKDMQGNITPWSDPLSVQIKFLSPADTSAIRQRSAGVSSPHQERPATFRPDWFTHRITGAPPP